MELTSEERKQKIEEVIDLMLSVVGRDVWDNSAFAYIRPLREIVFKKYGQEALKYMDVQIGILGSAGKGPWGGPNDRPMPVEA